MEKKIGQVTPEERNQIQALFERRNGLAELAKIITADNDDMYQKLIKDMGENASAYQRWWDEMSQKYHWPSEDDGQWSINFDTCEIFLITK